jgi:hypothetical protein
LLVRNASTLFAYWHISSWKIALTKEHCGSDWQDLRPSLRLYDISEIPFSASRAQEIRHICVKGQICCYIHGLRQGRTYMADIGIWNDQEQFLPLVRSNQIMMPCADVYDNSTASAAYCEYVPDPHLWSAQFPFGYDQFSAYTVYSPIPPFMKKPNPGKGGAML